MKSQSPECPPKSGHSGLTGKERRALKLYVVCKGVSSELLKIPQEGTYQKIKPLEREAELMSESGGRQRGSRGGE